jgi:hypothetical protein
MTPTTAITIIELMELASCLGSMFRRNDRPMGRLRLPLCEPDDEDSGFFPPRRPGLGMPFRLGDGL